MQSQVLSLKRNPYHKKTATQTKQSKTLKKDSRLFYVGSGLFLVGIAVGAVIVTMQDQTIVRYLNLLTQSGIESRVTTSFLVSALQCLMPNLLFLLLCLFCANCALGTPVIIALLVIRGISVGLVGGYVYVSEGLTGFLYSVLLLVPPVLVFVLALIKFAIIACRSSLYIFSMVYRNVGRNMKPVTSALYHSLFIASLASVLSALLESVLYLAFGKMFIS